MGGGNSKKAKKNPQDAVIHLTNKQPEFQKDIFTNIAIPKLKVNFEENHALPSLESVTSPKNVKGQSFGINKDL